MADEPTDEDLSKLELPSLRLPGLGRRSQRAARSEERREERAEERREKPAETPEPVVARGATAVVPESEPFPAEPAQGTSGTEQRLQSEPVEPPGPREPRTWSMPRPTLPDLSGRVAAAVTGLVVGVVGAALTYLSLRGCEAVKGTESCGGTGVPVLVVILALMVLVGAALLAAWGVAEARGTSFLGVGVLCVILLVALIEELFSGWMFLVVPVLAALSYTLSHLVTTAFVEPQPERGPQHDVR